MKYGYWVIVDGPLGVTSRGFETIQDAVTCAFRLLADGLYAVVMPV